MQSFRTEIENPIVEKDIIELEQKIRAFKNEEISEEKFKSLRLARGVYGQRQTGVQMIRIKLPYGKITGEQLIRIANITDKYSNGKLHITTRQDIQIHYVSLDRTPELWAELEKDDITLREACGNTVRNITASETAGIDPNEPFDVSPFAQGVFEYLLRNPICQELGRKFKISFSASEEDTALSYLHDVGLIAKVHDGQKGFKVLVGGGLGSQARHADVVLDFLPEDKLIPTIEGIIRVFDRYGEREKRNKARLKFLIKGLGIQKFLSLVEQERKALAFPLYSIEAIVPTQEIIVSEAIVPTVKPDDKIKYEQWLKTNVIRQKQEGLFAIGIKVQLGDFTTDQARKLADLIKNFGANEARFSLRQNILLRHIREDLLPVFYNELNAIGLAQPGYHGIGDITACPGTDTCNLAISDSTNLAVNLEEVLEKEYPHHFESNQISIKISGCMNSCGQHMMAQIGFQGMSIKAANGLIAPALQVLLGGENYGNGAGRFADKVIKIPSKRAIEALRLLLTDFDNNKTSDEKFVVYYERKSEKYFYNLLKPLAEVSQLNDTDFIDWGSDKAYETAIGIGECAGVTIDLVSTLLLESEEKINSAEEAFHLELWADSIYHSYSSLINSAKALLTAEGKKTNSYFSIINLFDEVFVQNNTIVLTTSFSDLVYQIKNEEPNESFAARYLQQAIDLHKDIIQLRQKSLEYAI